MENIFFVLRPSSEIHLKSSFVRSFFIKKLLSNIKICLKNKGINFTVQGKFSGIITAKSNFPFKAVPLIKNVFGVHSFSVAEQFSFSSLDDLNEIILVFAQKNLFFGDSFALRISRNGKQDFSSQDAAVQAGQKIMDSIKGLKVDLSNPKKEIFADIINKKVFLYSEKFYGGKGLPVGVEGKIGLIMTGKKEELVSGFLMLKRGCSIFPVLKKNDKKITQNLGLLSKFNSFREFKPVFFSDLQKEKNFLSALVLSQRNEKKALSEIQELKKQTGFVVFSPLTFFPDSLFNEVLEVIQ